MSEPSIVNLLERQGRLQRGAKDTNGQEEDSDYVAFAHGRIGLRQQVTLVFRKASGERWGFPYTHVDQILSGDVDKGFKMMLPAWEAAIEGVHLEPLFRYVCDHRAAEIVELERSRALSVPEGMPVVWSIAITPRAPRIC